MNSLTYSNFFLKATLPFSNLSRTLIANGVTKILTARSIPSSKFSCLPFPTYISAGNFPGIPQVQLFLASDEQLPSPHRTFIQPGGNCFADNCSQAPPKFQYKFFFFFLFRFRYTMTHLFSLLLRDTGFHFLLSSFPCGLIMRKWFFFAVGVV